MSLNIALQKRTIFKQHKNWYVLDDNFHWNIETLHQTIFKHLNSNFNVPVIFCSLLEANKIVHDLGHEEDEHLRFASGIYWRELGIIFIFQYDQYLSLVETLFHEFRHVMQDFNPDFRHHFESDKRLPYQDRITEKDAFQFTKEKMDLYVLDLIKSFLVS